ncbi:dephospho-CoA kinase [Pediococcus claussenii]|uniref:Dephospho-CoA kinase n=1 Tax=Pediococcus claussenii (strain ATCC BAA-344 / DSM 14800 / JCM 18046 / KCTC 3811 / LMG 21948 / P06) TaxID=701521 RepID=G8PDR7_PEDCP|nr:dephospho-CoA kinase [Pediococcus claussenii]AEV95402.1 dephospho-CoA kinase [Pediococcus claussenii ATCC BAA-344]ANZ68932.1 dephospho-CoA kinase [Pediococcus claussenii]ANZ70748.1 dephospho-CoA kinase [Pediococcus claussenii]KRN19045.1 coaE protein [Pediococcus claussenii]
MTKVIGLTGGIATGKSTVSDYFKKIGFPIVDADKIAHEILQKKSVQKALIKQFGAEIITGKHVDRKKLGSIVFKNENALNVLNEIVQPKIRRMILKQLKHFKRNNRVVVLDAPILLEQGYQNDVDFLMVVAVDRVTEISRLKQRDSLSNVEAEERINAQMSLNDKKKLADIVIDNSGTIADTELQVLKWLENNLLVR